MPKRTNKPAVSIHFPPNKMLLLLIAIVTVGLVIYIFTVNSAQEVAVSSVDKNGSKTYVNKTFKYTVEYPNSFIADDQPTYTGSKLPYSVIFDPSENEFGFPYLYVSVIPNGFSYSDLISSRYAIYNYLADSQINEFYTMKIGDKKFVDKDSYSRLPDIKLGNQDAIVFEGSQTDNRGDLKDMRVFVRNNGVTYEVGSYYPSSVNFQKFLISFKFTN